MEKKQTNEKKTENVKLRPFNHIKLYATNAFVGASRQDIRIDLCNEKLPSDKKDEWGYIIDATITLSPIGAKRLLKALQIALENYEKKEGEIIIKDDDAPIDFK